MNTDRETYKRYAAGRAKRSPVLRDTVRAFLIGGTICCLAQLLLQLYTGFGVGESEAGVWVSITLVWVTAVLTGLGIFDRIASFAGAGTLVPITGFANAVVSCAVDAKSEGLLLGVGANMFRIAGPVIAYGVAASVIYGVIYWITILF